MNSLRGMELGAIPIHMGMVNKRFFVAALLVSVMALDGASQEQQAQPPAGPEAASQPTQVPARIRNTYDFESWADDLRKTRWEVGLVLAGVTAQGLTTWNWGSSSFRFNSEGWFGNNTGSGGSDKLGHAFSSYALTNVLAGQLTRSGRSPERAALSAALTSQAIMTFVEVFDGFSGDHGFAYEDIVMNLAGSSIGYMRTINPFLRDTLDFRIEYQKSSDEDFRPMSDYEGQKFLFVFKLAGVDGLRDTPLRYVEFQAGYFARGFTDKERIAGTPKTRNGFFGVTLNLSELLLGHRSTDESNVRYASRTLLEHVQVPGISARHEF